MSYSHRDREWLERLQEHLAILERWGLVHVWSDTRIEVGEGWQEEIEDALTDSKVAVLLVSPAFMASTYIWEMEWPRILRHSRTGGLVILPLIVRACAWRLVEELRQLLVRPTDGRPLAVGSDAQIDLDLAAFAYELAARVNRFPSDMAGQEREIAEEHRAEIVMRPPDRSPEVRMPDGSTGGQDATEQLLPRVWRGTYNNDYRIELRIESWSDAQFTGTMSYLDSGTVTHLEGRRTTTAAEVADVIHRLRLDAGASGDVRTALIFRESAVVTVGSRSINLDGEYLAIVRTGSMNGAWFSRSQKVAEFQLRPDKQ
ncbi:toll/interleukin-1 receptor domain-containing protein [Geodermatophilus sp. URMC 62]|uniref:toll/interleukin-1 receptor domain-containing protein n=1 Tax=Geodermatophilus sp. URMC 62 TaxID=3423414 RepID=UPI00406C81F9